MIARAIWVEFLLYKWKKKNEKKEKKKIMGLQSKARERIDTKWKTTRNVHRDIG